MYIYIYIHTYMYKYIYTHINVFIYVGERECCARGPKGRKLPLLSCGNQRIHRPTCQGNKGTKTSVACRSSSATSCSTSSCSTPCQGAAQVEFANYDFIMIFVFVMDH